MSVIPPYPTTADCHVSHPAKPVEWLGQMDHTESAISRGQLWVMACEAAANRAGDLVAYREWHTAWWALEGARFAFGHCAENLRKLIRKL